MTATAQDITIRTFADAQQILAEALPGYTRRPHQEQLAAAIENAIEMERILLAQAGCGTGKSLGALIPAIIHSLTTGNRVIVATATKALQNQYKDFDLPFLAEHLGLPFRWALLKGRSNYWCLNKAEQLGSPTGPQAQAALLLKEQADHSGDRDELPAMSGLEWSQVSSTATECPGKKDCPFGTMCFTEKAKARAEAANVVVTNTAMFMQDLLLRTVGVSEVTGDPLIELLGKYGLVVFDEADELVDIATDALSDTIGPNALTRLISDATRLDIDIKGAREVAVAYELLWDVLAEAFAHSGKLRGASKETDPILIRQLGQFRPLISEAILGVVGTLRELRVHVFRVYDESPDDKTRSKARSVMRRIEDWDARLTSFAEDSTRAGDINGYARWLEQDEIEVRGRKETRLILRSAPVSPARFLKEMLWSKVPAVLMSATLAIGDDWSHLERWLGLADEPGKVNFDAGTPFDYAAQSRLFVPDKLVPAPQGATKSAATAWAREVTAHMVEQSGGGALLLFTSRSELEGSWRALAPRLRKAGLLCLKQGDAPSGDLKAQFAADGNAVLWGLKTFMRGIDVQGSALRLVILDKLPFAVPTDILYQERCEILDQQARDKWRDGSFTRLAIPMMSLVLIQAFGRLIRHVNDKGVVAVLDSRLSSKGYGTQILASMPAPKSAQTKDVHEAMAFLTGRR